MKNTINNKAVGNTFEGIDVLSCVQGNTARAMDPVDQYRKNCVVYDFPAAVSARAVSTVAFSEDSDRTAVDRRRIRNRRRKAARERRVRVMAIRTCVLAAFLIVAFIVGGIASRAQNRKVPEAYKYYDTITVAYQENLLDIVQRYDNRDYYDTQLDYVEELCRINNIAYDGTAYPEVAPGTHLVVPYYSSELK